MTRCRPARSWIERYAMRVLHDKFILHYQPLFSMTDQSLIGFEALIRFPAGDGSLIPPLITSYRLDRAVHT